jgi:putative ABC transport system permease protein
MNVPLAILRLTLSRDRAAAALGDLEEELARRATEGRAPASPATWLFLQAVRFTMAAGWSAMPRLLRSGRGIARDAVRGLRSSPSTTLAAVSILTLGISAATVTFSVVDHVVLRRLPFPDDDRLVVLEGSTARTPRIPDVSPVDFHAWRAGTDAFERLAMWHPTTFINLRRGDRTDTVASIAVSEDLLTVLGVSPVAGRAFEPGDHQRGASRVALASHGFWLRQLGGDPAAIGRTIPTASGSITVVGVMPRGFAFPLDAAQPIEFWTPYAPAAGEETLSGREGRTTDARVIGRLRAGASIDLARGQAARVSARLAASHPAAYEGWTPRVSTLHEALVGRVERWMALVLVAVGVVMAVACVNVANLLLARAMARTRDLAVRAALGAGRARSVATLAVEGLLVALAAAGAGVLAARWGVDIARTALPAGIARADAIALDVRVLAMALVAALATGLAAGIVPAWQAGRLDLVDALKSGGATPARTKRGFWRRALLVSELAFVVLLLVVTALFVTSFVRVTGLDLGFERRNLVGVRPAPALAGVPAADRAIRENDLIDRAVEAVRTVPGVASVSLSAGADLPFGFVWNARVEAPNLAGGTTVVEADLRGVSDGYFETAQIRLLRGRAFDSGDREGTPRVAIIDELSSRQLFGDRDPIGQEVRLFSQPSTIVGVAANVRLLGPEGRRTGQFYYALSQSPKQGQRQLIIRTHDRVSRLVPALSAAVASVMPPGSRPARVVVLDDRFRALTADRRFSAGLMLVFGALALVIGAAGVYSVMAFTVSQQTRDLGVRVSLGATRGAIIGQVLAQAGRYIAAGTAIGLAAAWAVSGWLSSLLFGVTATDPSIYAIVAVTIGAVSAAAAFVPAWRASRIDPLTALRT